MQTSAAGQDMSVCHFPTQRSRRLIFYMNGVVLRQQLQPTQLHIAAFHHYLAPPVLRACLVPFLGAHL